MRRRKKRANQLWTTLGAIIIIIAAVIVIRDVFQRASSGHAGSVSAGTIATTTTATAAATTTIRTALGKMYLRGTTVTARGKTYDLSSATNLMNPGRFAVEGKIVQIISDPSTSSQTPYYYVLQDNGSPVLVGAVVPASDAKDFSANTFSVGTTILAAGVVFSSGTPTINVFDYGEILQEIHVAPGLRGLAIPSNTPYLGANFQDIGVVG